MTHQVKMLVKQAQGSQFDLWDLGKGGRRERLDSFSLVVFPTQMVGTLIVYKACPQHWVALTHGLTPVLCRAWPQRKHGLLRMTEWEAEELEATGIPVIPVPFL